MKGENSREWFPGFPPPRLPLVSTGHIGGQLWSTGKTVGNTDSMEGAQNPQATTLTIIESAVRFNNCYTVFDIRYGYIAIVNVSGPF